jgi:hypothetical protein
MIPNVKSLRNSWIRLYFLWSILLQEINNGGCFWFLFYSWKFDEYQVLDWLHFFVFWKDWTIKMFGNDMVINGSCFMAFVIQNKTILIKIHIIVPINHMFCVDHCLNKYEFLKMCRFCQILCFVLKIYYNFESYQNIQITLGFCLLYHNYNFVLYVMHITPYLHVIMDYWNFDTYFEFVNISNSITF